MLSVENVDAFGSLVLLYLSAGFCVGVVAEMIKINDFFVGSQFMFT